MSKVDEGVITRASIEGLEALSRMLESDPEAIAAMPLEDIEKELRVMNLESKETVERFENSKDRGRHPTARENSSEETIKRMRSLNERSAKFRELLRAIRETNPR
jgi:hypothetical protein